MNDPFSSLSLAVLLGQAHAQALQAHSIGRALADGALPYNASASDRNAMAQKLAHGLLAIHGASYGMGASAQPSLLSALSMSPTSGLMSALGGSPQHSLVASLKSAQQDLPSGPQTMGAPAPLHIAQQTPMPTPMLPYYRLGGVA